MLDPEILLLDEPFSALDPITRRDIHTWFLEIKNKAPRTTILVTHDIREALFLSDIIVVLRQGRIIAQGRNGETGFRDESELIDLYQEEGRGQ
jgi:ABC-type proline/glycine betaine transport system ATPase subunit